MRLIINFNNFYTYLNYKRRILEFIVCINVLGQKNNTHTSAGKPKQIVHSRGTKSERPNERCVAQVTAIAARYR